MFIETGFFRFLQKKKIFSSFYKQLIFNYLKPFLARVRSMFGKRGFLRRSKKFFLKKFWRLEKRFYNAVYSKAKQNGRQVRRKKIDN